MAWAWLVGIIKKAAAEVHKTKISEFETRLLEIERKQEVILKSIRNHESTLEKLDNRIYEANIQSAKAIGAIDTVVQAGYLNQKLISQDSKNDDNTGQK